MFKAQNNEYNYTYVENYIYKKLKEAVEIYKNQTKSHSVYRKYITYILYVLLNVMLLETVFSFTKHNGMLQAKQMTNVLSSLRCMAQYAHRFHIIW